MKVRLKDDSSDRILLIDTDDGSLIEKSADGSVRHYKKKSNEGFMSSFTKNEKRLMIVLIVSIVVLGSIAVGATLYLLR